MFLNKSKIGACSQDAQNSAPIEKRTRNLSSFFHNLPMKKCNLSELSRCVNKPRKIIEGYVVEACKRLVVLHRHLPRTAFPASILLLPSSQQGRYLGLRFVRVLSDISESLVKLHSISSDTCRFNGSFLCNKQIISHTTPMLLTLQHKWCKIKAHTT